MATQLSRVNFASVSALAMIAGIALISIAPAPWGFAAGAVCILLAFLVPFIRLSFAPKLEARGHQNPHVAVPQRIPRVRGQLPSLPTVEEAAAQRRTEEAIAEEIATQRHIAAAAYEAATAGMGGIEIPSGRELVSGLTEFGQGPSQEDQREFARFLVEHKNLVGELAAIDRHILELREAGYPAFVIARQLEYQGYPLMTSSEVHQRYFDILRRLQDTTAREERSSGVKGSIESSQVS
jgi:hypothetical protein